MAPRSPLILLLAILLLALAAGCAASGPEWEDSETSGFGGGGNTATIQHFDYAELTAKASATFPPCHDEAGELLPVYGACIPLPCKEKDGTQGEWYVALRVDSFEISPYEPRNEVRTHDNPKDREILKQDADDADYWFHVGVRNKEPDDNLTGIYKRPDYLTCSGDLP